MKQCGENYENGIPLNILESLSSAWGGEIMEDIDADQLVNVLCESSSSCADQVMKTEENAGRDSSPALYKQNQESFPEETKTNR